MEKVERVLIKLVIIQFLFLIFGQLIFHQLNIFPEIKQITKYEGVNKNNFTEIIQTFSRNK